MTKTMAALALLAGLGLALPPAAADDQRQGVSQSKTTDKALPAQDFVRQAASSGMFEVRSSEDAERRATSDAVKQFARHMVQDHTRANQELMALAQRKGWAVPPGVDQKHFDLLAKLGPMTGTALDAEYARIQVQAHEEAVALFEAQSTGGQDPDLKAWAAKTLPTLREHLKMAQDLAKNVGKAGSGK